MSQLVSQTRILNELIFMKFEYKLYSLLNSFKLIYYNNKNEITIIYSYKYPTDVPIIKINNINIYSLYNKIITENKNILINDFNFISLINKNNWNINYNINKINDDIDKLIILSKFRIQKIMLNKIINKYSNYENMDYLYYYLLQ